MSHRDVPPFCRSSYGFRLGGAFDGGHRGEEDAFPAFLTAGTRAWVTRGTGRPSAESSTTGRAVQQRAALRALLSLSRHPRILFPSNASLSRADCRVARRVACPPSKTIADPFPLEAFRRAARHGTSRARARASIGRDPNENFSDGGRLARPPSRRAFPLQMAAVRRCTGSLQAHRAPRALPPDRRIRARARFSPRSTRRR